MTRSPFEGFVFTVSCALAGAGCTPTRSTDATSAHDSVVAEKGPSTTTTGDARTSYARASKDELKARLTPLQFEVTQNAATEPPFRNAYWDNHEAGIYVDVATGEPLFSSRDKFDSGTGWPSFTRPLEQARVVERTDGTLGMKRTEVVSSAGASHLGHVFDDGPAPTRTRYCINSASLRFVPASRLVAEGYGAYAAPFGLAPSAPSAAARVEAPADSANACAKPPPGATPGCNSTLAVAVFAKAPGDDRVARPEGVLDVAEGFVGASSAVEVTFDPAKISYADLLRAWTKGREKQSTAFAQDDAQKKAATAAVTSGLRVQDAAPFRRE